MTSKERVLTALHRSEPDRVPIDYSANPGIDARLKAHFGLAADDREGLLEALNVDFRGVSARYAGPTIHEDIPGIRVNPEWGIRTKWVEHESGGYWDYCDFPLKEADEEQVAAWPMPNPDHYDYSHIEEACDKNAAYGVFCGGAGLGDIINSSGMIRGMEQVLVDLITDEPAGLLLIDRKMEVQLQVLRRVLEAAKGKIDFVWLGEDLGTQKSPMISLDLYRKHLRPRHQQYIDVAKSYDLPVMIHTCGSSSWAYNDFIEMGIDAVDTLQPEAVNMSPEYLKTTFGHRLAFHGCISTAGPVAFGTVQEVEEDVRRVLDVMMPGGGYCFSPTHQLQDNSPTENVLRMYELAVEAGTYR